MAGVEKRVGFFLSFPGQLDSLMNGVKARLEVSCRVPGFSGRGAAAAAKAGAALRVVYEAPYVVHVEAGWRRGVLWVF